LLRILPDGRGEVLATGLYAPNGVALGPDEDAVYVLESFRDDCLRIDLTGSAKGRNPEVFSESFPGLPDGMAFDEQGTMYVTIPLFRDRAEPVPANQIIEIDRSGRWSTLIDDGAGERLAVPTNVAFGGEDRRTMYVSNLEGDHISSVRMPVAGHLLPHQRA
jgi:gluconolactonase